MAPELFQYGQRPTTAVDMFSYGVLALEGVTGERPWRRRGHVLARRAGAPARVSVITVIRSYLRPKDRLKIAPLPARCCGLPAPRTCSPRPCHSRVPMPGHSSA